MKQQNNIPLMVRYWPIITAAAILIGSYSVVQYRISGAEALAKGNFEKTVKNERKIAEHEKDIRYIGVLLSKIDSKIDRLDDKLEVYTRNCVSMPSKESS